MRTLYAALPLLLACSSSTDGALVLSMSTDLLVPADVNSVGLYVQQLDGTGAVREQWKFSATPLFDPARAAYVVHFPASLVLQSRGEGSDRVRARAVAFTGNAVPLVVREARVNVPTTGSVVLKLPLLWLNAGTAGDTEPGVAIDDSADFDPMTRFTTGCPPEQTRGDDGTCVGIDVPLESLPKAEDEAAPVACVDPATVFSPGADLVRLSIPDGSAGSVCTFALARPFDSTKTNVGVIGTSGYAAGDELVRPLTSKAYSIAGTTLTLGAGACARLGDVKALVVSARSATLDERAAICAPWQTETEPELVEAGAPVLEVPDATTPDADVPDADAELPDADPSVDAGPPTTWDLGTEATSLAIGAGGIYVSYSDTVKRFPLEPGPATLSLAPPVGVILSNQGDGTSDALLGFGSSRLYRLDPTTLVATIVDPCSSGCAVDGITYRIAPGYAKRGGNGRIYYLLEIPQMGPPLYSVSSTLGDGTDPATQSSIGVNVTNGESLQFMLGQPTGAAVYTLYTDFYTGKQCSGTSPCGAGGGYFSASTGSDYQPSVGQFSPLVGNTFFARASWSVTDQQTQVVTGYSGVVRVVDSTLTLVAPGETVNDALIRKADVACWRADGTAVRCISADGVTTGPVVTLPGVDASRGLYADSTYIYWVDATGKTLHRRAWASKETAD